MILVSGIGMTLKYCSQMTAGQMRTTYMVFQLKEL